MSLSLNNISTFDDASSVVSKSTSSLSVASSTASASEWKGINVTGAPVQPSNVIDDWFECDPGFEFDNTVLRILVNSQQVASIIYKKVGDPEDPGAFQIAYASRQANAASRYDFRQVIGQTLREAFPRFMETGMPEKFLEIFNGNSFAPVNLGEILFGDEKVCPSYFDVLFQKLDSHHCLVQYTHVSSSKFAKLELLQAQEESRKSRLAEETERSRRFFVLERSSNFFKAISSLTKDFVERTGQSARTHESISADNMWESWSEIVCVTLQGVIECKSGFVATVARSEEESGIIFDSTSSSSSDKRWASSEENKSTSSSSSFGTSLRVRYAYSVVNDAISVRELTTNTIPMTNEFLRSDRIYCGEFQDIMTMFHRTSETSVIKQLLLQLGDHGSLANYVLLPLHVRGRLMSIIGFGNLPSDWFLSSDARFSTVDSVVPSCSSSQSPEFPRKSTSINNILSNLQPLIYVLESLFYGIEAEILQVKYSSFLLSARAIAENAAVSKTQFLSNMSHEIRTPLNACIGMSQYLLMSNELAPSLRGPVDAIYRSGELLLCIVNDILDLSKMETGKMSMDVVEIDLIEFLDSTLSHLIPMAKKKNIRLSKVVPSSIAKFICTDDTMLRKILVNVLANAIKFTPKDGSVTLIVHCDKLSNSKNDEYMLKLTVRDTGIGILPSKLETIFEAFTQVDGSTTREFGGTGLGLTICRQLAGLMGGTIVAESDGIGYGTSFIVRIPVVCLSSDVTALNDSVKSYLTTVNPLLRGKSVILLGEISENESLLKYVKTWGLNIELFMDVSSLTTLYSRSDKATPEFIMVMEQGASVSESPSSGVQLMLQVRASTSSLTNVHAILLCPAPDAIQSHPKFVQAKFFATASLLPLKPSELSDALVRCFLNYNHASSMSGNRSMADSASNLYYESEALMPVSQVVLSNAIETIAIESENDVNWKAAPSHPASSLPLPVCVLIVEDIIENQQVMQLFLNHAGYKNISVVENGLDAVRMCSSNDYDIVFMDNKMPLLGGLEATRRIRENALQMKNLKSSYRSSCMLPLKSFATSRSNQAKPNEGPIIIAVTAAVTPSEQLLFEAAGIDYFLCKPLRFEDFCCVLREVDPGFDARLQRKTRSSTLKNKAPQPDVVSTPSPSVMNVNTSYSVESPRTRREREDADLYTRGRSSFSTEQPGEVFSNLLPSNAIVSSYSFWYWFVGIVCVLFLNNFLMMIIVGRK